MKRLALALLCCFSLAASASKKPEPVYQDGVLIKVQDVDNGVKCHTDATGNGHSDDNGNTRSEATADTTCSERIKHLYTVKVGDSLFILEASQSNKQKGIGMATLGWSNAFNKENVLAYQLPGSHVQVRSDENGIHIKVGKRESLYTVVGGR